MSFQQGLSGLSAASQSLAVIGNNVANSSTVGFKQSQAQFADVYASSLNGAGASPIGIGTTLQTVAQQFTQGNITASSNPLDIAINGGGFFRMNTNGAITFSRNGQFQLDKSGYIVNAQGSRLSGFAADASGALSAGAPTDLMINTADQPPQFTTEVNALLNLNSGDVAPTVPFAIDDPMSYNSSTSIAVFDSLGNSHVLQTFFRKTSAGMWDVYASGDNLQIGTTPIGTLGFNESGAIDPATTTPALPFNLTIPVSTGGSDITMDLDFAGTTQFGSTFSVNTLNQDGFAPGRLAGFNISPDGSLVGRYTNGQSAVLGQVVLANFTNPNGLQPLGGNAWAESAASGAPLVGTPNSGGLGTLQSSAVENSNVDLTSELVNMITAQRFYQANAQTIKTQDQVLQTLVNLR